MGISKTDNLSDLLATAVADLLMGDVTAQRVEAAQRLGRTQNKIAAAYLIQALSDQAPEVRLAAVDALGEIGDPAAIDPLKRLLDRETNPTVSRSDILRALDRIQRPEEHRPFASTDQQPHLSRKDLPAVAASSLFSTAKSLDLEFSPPPVREAERVTSTGLDRRFENGFPPGADEEEHRLEESFRRAATERRLLQEARQRSSEEANRRAAEELLGLEAEEESLTRLQENLRHRRSQVEASRAAAEEAARQLKELEDRVKAEKSERVRFENEAVRLETEARIQADEARRRRENLQRLA